MKSLTQLVIKITVLLFTINCQAQIKNKETKTVKINGNCDMCKNRIESAVYKKNIAKANWNLETKTAVITYDSAQTTLSDVLKQIAYAGYDNDKFIAPEKAYVELPACCQYNRKITTNTSSGIRINNNAAVIDSSRTLILVYTAYFTLQHALANDDGNSAATKAKEMVNAIDNLPMDKMSTDAHAVWMKYKGKLSFDAGHIAGTTAIEDQREHFISLSENMYGVIHILKSEKNVYYQYCPMANEGKGANWLSEQKEINNPYMGKKMPTCGTTVETIKN